MSASAIVSVAAAVVAALAALGAGLALLRSRRVAVSLEAEIERGRARFAEVVDREVELQAQGLEETLALARSEALSLLAVEERRIAEERRHEVAERERQANARLNAALAEAQRAVEQRFADWGAHLDALQQNLSGNFERLGQRQRQLAVQVEARIADEAQRFQAQLDEHRGSLGKLRDELERSVQDVVRAASNELDAHVAEQNRALQEMAERFHRREEEIQKQIEREQNEVSQRVAAQVQEVEHRHVEQLRRVVARESQQTALRAAQEFETTIRSAREDAARRLARQLDIAVERFVRDAELMLSERVEAELRGVDGRLRELAQRIDALSARV